MAMKLVKLWSMLSMPLILGACAIPQTVEIGSTEAQVIAARGNPTHRYRVGNEELLEYRHGPYGQKTYMARIGPDGKLISFQQVLTDEMFATIKIGAFTKEDVLHTVGAPSDRAYFPLSQLEVWSYPYRQYEVWDSFMHVGFDHGGIVRKMETTPDIRFRNDLFGPR